MTNHQYPGIVPSPLRAIRGRRAHALGLDAEALCCAALRSDGWEILGQRLRTACGEIDIAASQNEVLAFVEVKSSARLATAAHSLSSRQIRRLIGAAEILIAENPGWGVQGVRFDLMVVDAAGTIRRVADAFRIE